MTEEDASAASVEEVETDKFINAVWDEVIAEGSTAPTAQQRFSHMTVGELSRQWGKMHAECPELFAGLTFSIQDKWRIEHFPRIKSLLRGVMRDEMARGATGHDDHNCAFRFPTRRRVRTSSKRFSESYEAEDREDLVLLYRYAVLGEKVADIALSLPGKGLWAEYNPSSRRVYQRLRNAIRTAHRHAFMETVKTRLKLPLKRRLLLLEIKDARLRLALLDCLVTYDAGVATHPDLHDWPELSAVIAKYRPLLDEDPPDAKARKRDF